VLASGHFSQFRVSSRCAAYRRNVTDLATRLGIRRILAARAEEPWFGGADSPVTGRVDSRWTLPVLSVVLCVITAGSMLANGSVAFVWLGFGLAAVLGGVPAYLVVARLRGNPSDDR